MAMIKDFTTVELRRGKKKFWQFIAVVLDSIAIVTLALRLDPQADH